MSTPYQLSWQHPLALAPALDAFPTAALLYSGAHESGNHYSYLAVGAKEKCTGSDLSLLSARLTRNGNWHDNMWLGWLGYGLKNQLEHLPVDAPAPIPTEDYCLFQPETIYRFNHTDQSVECYGEHQLEAYWQHPPKPDTTAPNIMQLRSDMDQPTYLHHVKTILEAIRAGTLYQANLTRKFSGRLAAPLSAGSAFKQLCTISPASYSALMQINGLQVLSSSPELFLDINANGAIRSRPIKGTMRRDANPSMDATLKQQLSESAKNRAENLMIVDLMRNDLSRVCELGSIKVDQLFHITSHAHIHHMSSEVAGQLRPDADAMAAVTACFPPGSMTGAPKIKAMQLCSQLEPSARGIYSGALGWFGGDGSAHLSVVIRTLIVKDTDFEFQVGGGIVADSNAVDELEETLHKARGIAELLGISKAQLADL